MPMRNPGFAAAESGTELSNVVANQDTLCKIDTLGRIDRNQRHKGQLFQECEQGKGDVKTCFPASSMIPSSQLGLKSRLSEPV